MNGGNAFVRRARWTPVALLAACAVGAVGAEKLWQPYPETPEPMPGPDAGVPTVVQDFPCVPGALRNSEGDFIRLKDGRILFAYTRFTDHRNGRGYELNGAKLRNLKGAGDHDPADLVARFSSDEGRTWTKEDRVLFKHPANAWNAMSADLQRLPDGRIALGFCIKGGPGNCCPFIMFSSDEAATWTAPKGLLPHGNSGYYGWKNQGSCLTKKGRFVVPQYGPLGVQCLVSDDFGASWRMGEPIRAFDADGRKFALDETQLIELSNGLLAAYSRSYVDWQFVSYSRDGGLTWGAPVPSGLVSPGSPCTIVRLKNGDWLVAWNDLKGNPPHFEGCGGKRGCNGSRTPMTLAISKDEGRTWIHRAALEGLTHNRGYYYCYPSMFETADGHVLVHYCYIGRRAMDMLAESHVVRVPLKWVYGHPEVQEPRTMRGFLDRFQ